MGTFSVPIQVASLERSGFAEIEALVDTGAVHSYIPRDILYSVNAQPTEMREFVYADERVEEIPFGYIRFVVEGLEIVAPVIFADEGMAPLLGATTLEAGHFVVDPIHNRLTPIIPPGRSGNGRPIVRR